jgi:hypothetical protein
VGQGSQVIGVQIGEVAVEAGFMEELLLKLLERFPSDTPVTMTFRTGNFQSGHDLRALVDRLGLEIKIDEVEQ